MTTKSLLTVEDVSVAHGKVPAVSNVSLRVCRNQIITVIGPNGAGKSTLLNALMGVLPSTGHVEFEGNDISSASVEDRVQRGISLVPEGRELFSEMSVLDNLLLGSYPRYRKGERKFDRDLESIYGTFPRLAERRGQRAGTLSGGERQMLAIGRALMARPRLLMLDEPSLGLAPRIVREILRTVVSLRETGVALLIIEQNARAALHISDFGYVMERGRVVLQGDASSLQENRSIAATYLGSMQAN